MKLSPFPKETYERNAEIYKILSNAKRLEILNILNRKELTVEQLAEELKIRISNISQHLALLRHYRLVKTRRSGKNIYYRITSPDIVKPCKTLHHLLQKKLT